MTGDIDRGTTNDDIRCMSNPILPTIPALSLLDECARPILSATTAADLDVIATSYRDSKTSPFRALCESDKVTIRDMWAKRGALVTLSAIWTGMWAGVGGPIPTPATTIAEDLQTIATSSARMAAVPTRRVTRQAPVRRDQTPEAIATATIAARAAGQRLAGYGGQVVDPADGRGLGTMVIFGKAYKERDLVSDRDRQALIRWSTVVGTLVVHGFAADLLGEAVSPVAALGQATKILNQSGYLARNARPGNGIVSAWIIGKIDTKIDSDTLGDRECMITLDKAGNVKCSSDLPAAAQVVREYRNRIDSILIEASDLRIRIEATLCGKFGARDTDLGLYISPYHTDAAMRLILALRPIAGRKIYASAYTDKGTLGEALCDSFVADLGKLETEIAKSSDDLKRRAGAALISQIERLKAEVAALGGILGDSAVAGYRARLDACDASVGAALDATASRFANLELD